MKVSGKGMAVAAAAAALAVGAAGGVSASDDTVGSASRDSSCSVAGKRSHLRHGTSVRFGNDRVGQRRSEAGPGLRTRGATAPAARPGELTAEQRTDLAEMAQEEKLAHDLYAAFARLYDDQRFDQISNAETRHLGAVRSLLATYDIADPTEGTGEGEFTSKTWQGIYAELLAAGSESLADALESGATVERTDIADLQSAMADLDASNVVQVYSQLLSGSQRHLQAFTR